MQDYNYNNVGKMLKKKGKRAEAVLPPLNETLGNYFLGVRTFVPPIYGQRTSGTVTLPSA